MTGKSKFDQRRDGAMLVRTIYVWWFYAVFYGFVFLLTAGTALNSSVPAAGRLIRGAIASGIALFMLNARTAGVAVDTSQVIVKRYLGITRTVPWSEVAEFKLVPNGSFNGGVFIAVVLTDGKKLTTQGLVARSRASARAHELVSRLEGMRPSTPRGEPSQ
jgi:hypothetical protein